MQQAVLVTGANGHLGNNLVRLLSAKNETVIAGVRQSSRRDALNNVPCGIRFMDFRDRKSLAKAMDGVRVLYQVGAVFKHWAKDPDKEIYQANLEGTRNTLDAAATAGVERVVHVSSLGAVDRSQTPITEATWNPVTTNTYFRSKTDAEKLAWELSAKHGLEMVSVLPGAIVGENCFGLTPTMGLLNTILAGKLSLNPGFFFNFVDAGDVAEGCWLAATKGRAGERYLLANEACLGIGEIVQIAQREFPQYKIKTPGVPPRWLMRTVVTLIEAIARVRGVEPELQRNFLTEFGICENCDISKARSELGFNPQRPGQAVAKALHYLNKERH